MRGLDLSIKWDVARQDTILPNSITIDSNVFRPNLTIRAGNAVLNITQEANGNILAQGVDVRGMVVIVEQPFAAGELEIDRDDFWVSFANQVVPAIEMTGSIQADLFFSVGSGEVNLRSQRIVDAKTGLVSLTAKSAYAQAVFDDCNDRIRGIADHFKLLNNQEKRICFRKIRQMIDNGRPREEINGYAQECSNEVIVRADPFLDALDLRCELCVDQLRNEVNTTFANLLADDLTDFCVIQHNRIETLRDNAIQQILVRQRVADQHPCEAMACLVGQRYVTANTSPKRQRVNDLRLGSLAGDSGSYFSGFQPEVALSNQYHESKNSLTVKRLSLQTNQLGYSLVAKGPFKF